MNKPTSFINPCPVCGDQATRAMAIKMNEEQSFDSANKICIVPKQTANKIDKRNVTNGGIAGDLVLVIHD